MKARAVLAGVVLITGCDVLGLGKPQPEASHEWRGLRFELVVRSPEPGESLQSAALRITNASGDRIIRNLEVCPGYWPRLYRASDLSRPVWTSRPRQPLLFACTGGPTVDLRPRESVEPGYFRFPLDPDWMLGDSLPDGRYVPGVLYRPPNDPDSRFILVTSGAVELRR